MHKWVIFLEGGGWCGSLDECLERSKSQLGSSRTYKGEMHFDAKKNLIRPTREVRAWPLDRAIGPSHMCRQSFLQSFFFLL